MIMDVLSVCAVMYCVMYGTMYVCCVSYMAVVCIPQILKPTFICIMYVCVHRYRNSWFVCVCVCACMHVCCVRVCCVHVCVHNVYSYKCRIHYTNICYILTFHTLWYKHIGVYSV